MVDVAPAPHPAQPHPTHRRHPAPNPRPPRPKPGFLGRPRPPRPRPARCTNPIVQTGPIQTRPTLPPPPCGSCPAPAGAVVFHRFLQNLNRTPFPSAPPFAIQPASTAKVCREPDRYEPSSPNPAASPHHPGPGLLPKLGEVLPVTPQPQTRAVVDIPRPIQRQTGSGRLVDLLA